MNYKKSPARSVGSTQSGRKTVVSFPCLNDNIEYLPKQFPVAAHLRRGENNRISSEMLLTITGISSTRELRRFIHDERLRGALIISSASGGYFLPDYGEKGQCELRRFLKTINSHALTVLQTARASQMALHDNTQMEINLDG